MLWQSTGVDESLPKCERCGGMEWSLPLIRDGFVTYDEKGENRQKTTKWHYEYKCRLCGNILRAFNYANEPPITFTINGVAKEADNE